MSRIKVLHIIKGLGRGGAETLLPETYRVHDKEQFAFQYLYFLPHKNQVAQDLRELGCQVDCTPATTFPGMLARIPAIIKIVKKSGVNLIHCHLPLSGVIGRLVGKITGVPVIYTEHNIQERYNAITRTLNLRTIALNRRVICCSQDVQDSLNRYASDSYRDCILTVQNGVNTQRFDPQQYVNRKEIAIKLGLPTDKRIIGTVCVFREQKNLLLWVRVASALAKKINDVHFVLVGDGPQETQIKQAIDAVGLTDYFTLPGRLQEVRPYLSCFDIYLMTSKFEGLPIALLEAMAMKLPIVSSKVGGIPEAVRQGREGYLVDPAVDSPFDYVGDLVRLLENDNERAKMAEAARRRVQEAFSVKNMAGTLEKLYCEVVQPNPS